MVIDACVGVRRRRFPSYPLKYTLLWIKYLAIAQYGLEGCLLAASHLGVRIERDAMLSLQVVEETYAVSTRKGLGSEG